MTLEEIEQHEELLKEYIDSPFLLDLILEITGELKKCKANANLIAKN